MTAASQGATNRRDQRPTEATLTPAEARSLAAALNHIATEATP